MLLLATERLPPDPLGVGGSIGMFCTCQFMGTHTVSTNQLLPEATRGKLSTSHCKMSTLRASSSSHLWQCCAPGGVGIVAGTTSPISSTSARIWCPSSSPCTCCNRSGRMPVGARLPPLPSHLRTHESVPLPPRTQVPAGHLGPSKRVPPHSLGIKDILMNCIASDHLAASCLTQQQLLQ